MKLIITKCDRCKKEEEVCSFSSKSNGTFDLCAKCEKKLSDLIRLFIMELNQH